MKLTTISSIVLLFIYFSGKAQIEDRYVSINLLRSYALGDFKAITEKDKMWGVNMELLTPVSQWWPWDIGVEVELLGAGSKTDNFEGLDIDSKSRFWRFGFVNRIRPFKSEGIDPYIEFGYGCNLSYTKTSYTIVDEITFLEWMATTFFSRIDLTIKTMWKHMILQFIEIMDTIFRLQLGQFSVGVFISK
jgi:hypothetical protein